MAATPTLIDPREQLLTGLRALLTPALSDLMDTTRGLRPAWGQIELQYPLGVSTATQPTLTSPICAIDIGAESAAPVQSGQNSAWTFTVQPADSGATTSTQYVAGKELQVPVTFICAAAGVNNHSMAGQVRQAVTGVLGRVASVPLPDNSTTDPPTYTLGFKAQLVGYKVVPDRSQEREKIARLNVLYTAVYAEYHTETVGIVRTTTIKETIGDEQQRTVIVPGPSKL